MPDDKPRWEQRFEIDFGELSEPLRGTIPEMIEGRAVGIVARGHRFERYLNLETDTWGWTCERCDLTVDRFTLYTEVEECPGEPQPLWLHSQTFMSPMEIHPGQILRLVPHYDPGNPRVLLGFDVQVASTKRKAQMKPTVGRIVHYTNLGDADGRFPPEAHAAMITKVHDDTAVALCIFYPTGVFFMERVQQTLKTPGTDEARGKWGWPPRVS